MPVSIGLPDRYSFVLAAATSTFFLNTFHAYRTSKLREYSGIKYPAAYATEEQVAKDFKAFKFNCAQRAHANFTENLTPFLGSLLIAGLRFPITAAVIGAVWSASRAWYLIGYTVGGPKGYRVGHVPAFFADFALKLMATYTVYTLITV